MSVSKRVCSFPFRRVQLAAFLSFLLTACTEQTDGTPPSCVDPVPDYVLASLFDVGVAEMLAENCKSIGFRSALGDQQIERLLGRVVRDGFTLRDLNYWQENIPEAELRRRLDLYAAERKIVPQQEASVCAAASAEIAAGTKMGGFLYRQ